MTRGTGWNPTFALLLAPIIKHLTWRLGPVCELTTSVYVPLATVSRLICFARIHPKHSPFNGFSSMATAEHA